MCQIGKLYQYHQQKKEPHLSEALFNIRYQVPKRTKPLFYQLAYDPSSVRNPSLLRQCRLGEDDRS